MKSYEIQTIDDTFRASLPLSDNDDDTFPIGIDLCFNGQKKFDLKPGVQFQPCPFLLILNNLGTLIVYHVVNQQQTQPLCKPPIPLPAPDPKQKPLITKPTTSAPFSFNLSMNNSSGAHQNQSMFPTNIQQPAIMSQPAVQSIQFAEKQPIAAPKQTSSSSLLLPSNGTVDQQILQKQTKQQSINFSQQDTKAIIDDNSSNVESKILSFTNELKQFKVNIQQMGECKKDVDENFGRKTSAGQNKFNEIESEMRVSLLKSSQFNI